jgi:hypothetical protein
MGTRLAPLLGLVLVVATTDAAASSWSHFANCGSANQQRTYWYDTSSVQSSGPDKLVRIRGDYSKVAGSVASRAEIWWSVNCSRGTFTERRRTERAANGKVVAKYTRATGVMEASPESVARKLMNRVCS